MAARVSVDLGRLFITLLLIAGVVRADVVCSAISVDPAQYQQFINSVYSSQGLLTLQTFYSMEQPVTATVERTTTAIVDQKANMYFSDEFNRIVADFDKSDIFPKEFTFDGPFYIVAVLDDTLRVSKDAVAGYAYGKGLQERFEGRSEYGSITKAVSALTDYQLFLQAFHKRIGSSPRIKNIIRAKNFSVTTTCASSACRQDMYSLLTKYMNLGASAQMIVEFAGGAVWQHIVPHVPGASGAKKWISDKGTKLRAAFEGKLKDMRSMLLDTAKTKMDDTTKTLLKGEPEKGLKGLTDDGFTVNRLKDIPYDQKMSVMAYTSAAVPDVEDAIQKLGSCMGGDCNPDELIKALKKASESLSVVDDVKITYVKDDKVYSISLGDLAKRLEEAKDACKKTDGCDPGKLQDLLEKADLTGFDVGVLLSKLSITEKNLKLLQEYLAANNPTLRTLASYVREGVEAKLPNQKVASQYTVAPVVYYLAKKAFLGRQENPFTDPEVFSLHKSFGLGVLSVPYPLPETWKIGAVYPPGKNGVKYSDAFVDILINNGSDPGDVFRSLLTLTGGPAIIRYVFSDVLHKDPPSGFGVIVTKEEEQLREMGPAVVAFGAPSCDDCIVSSRGDRSIFITSNLPADIFGSVVEDTNVVKEGSTAIIFGHHVNFKFTDAEVDISKAEEEGLSCYQTCRLLNLPGIKSTSPGTAMFIASWIQSGAFVFGLAGGIILNIVFYRELMEGCGSCVDDRGGYYLHLYVPPVEDQEKLIEGDPVSSGVADFLSAIKVALGQVSEQLEKEMERYIERMKAETVRNSAAYIQFDVDDMHNAEIHIWKMIKLWIKPKNVFPTHLTERGSLAGDSEDGRKVEFDKRKGEMRVNGDSILTEPDLLKLVYVDNTVPGIVVPTKVVVSSFSVSPAFEADKRGEYVVKDPDFLQCFAKHYGTKPDSESFAAIMGDLKAVVTSKGMISFSSKRAVGTTAEWSGIVYRVYVDGASKGYGVRVDAADYEVQEEGNELEVDIQTSERDFGSLESILFENGAVYVRDNKLLIHVRREAVIPGNYVRSVSLSPGEDGKLLPQFQADPSAPADVKEKIARLNELIKEMGGINAILAQNRAVAIVRDADGTLWLRIFDRNALAMISEENVAAILRSVLDGDGKYLTFETLDGSLRIKREGSKVTLTYLDKNSGQYVTESIVSYAVSNYTFTLTTDKGTHELRIIRREDGFIVAVLDGVDYGPVVVPGAVRQEKVLDMYQDPNNPNQLVVKTDQGTHTIRVDLDANGNPYLVMDDVVKGIISAMQGPKGYIAYDPDSGQWSFVAGLLTPLAEAFKNGIQISLNTNGQFAATPKAYTFASNPYAPQPGPGGINLPLFEGPELVFLILAIAFVFALTR